METTDVGFGPDGERAVDASARFLRCTSGFEAAAPTVLNRSAVNGHPLVGVNGVELERCAAETGVVVARGNVFEAVDCVALRAGEVGFGDGLQYASADQDAGDIGQNEPELHFGRRLPEFFDGVHRGAPPR